LWAALEGGDDADFARLGDYLPVVDMVQAKATRDHALVHRAMGFTPGWEAFPPLVSAVVAEDARDGALDGLLRLSSRERRAGEIDAPEALFAAADELAAWVGKGSGSKKDRARAVTVLRRLNVWGWVPKAELSKADDAK
jgi:hypothetical protein